MNACPICIWITSSGTSRVMARVLKVQRSQCVVAPVKRYRSFAGRLDACTARASQLLTYSYSAWQSMGAIGSSVEASRGAAGGVH